MRIGYYSAFITALAFCATVPVHADDTTPTTSTPPAAATSKAPVPDSPSVPDDSSSSASAPASASTSNVPDELVAHQFRLVNKAGRTTLLIKNRTNNDNAPAIWLYDPKGQARIGIAIDPDTSVPIVTLYNDKGDPRMIIGCEPANGDPVITQFDDAGTSRLTISVADGNPVVGLTRKDGSHAASMEVDDDIASVGVSTGDQRAAIDSSPKSNTSLSLMRNGSIVAMLGISSKFSAPYLTLRSGSGKPALDLIGAEKETGIGLCDSHGLFRARLIISSDGNGKLIFNNGSGGIIKSIPK